MTTQNCVVSNIHEWYQPKIEPWTATTTNTPSISFNVYTPRTVLELFEEVIAAARKLDKALGLPDCDTAAKTDWIKKLRKQVRDHELSKMEERLRNA